MSSRSLNKVILIGNLTRDPELRYTSQGTAVCTFGLATNRQWITESGEKKEDTEFHRVVAWNKLAELCSKFLTKGRKVYIEGRLQTRQYTASDGTPRQQTEIVSSEMILLDSRRVSEGEVPPVVKEEKAPAETVAPEEVTTKVEKGLPARLDSAKRVGKAGKSTLATKKTKKAKEELKPTEEKKPEEEGLNLEDIPF